MFKKFLNIFTGKKNQTNEKIVIQAPSAPKMLGQHVYDEHLIPQFVEDHRELINGVNIIVQYQNNNDWKNVDKALEEFKLKLYAHLLAENGNLYTYLQRSLNSQPDDLLMMRELQQEMRDISKVLAEFLSKYKNLANSTLLQTTFPKDFSAICAALSARINCEEKTLYPLYQDKAN